MNTPGIRSARQEIVLIGPVRSGKSTLGRLLAERLGLSQVSLDELRWRYYREAGYDEQTARAIRKQGGFMALVHYWSRFGAYSVERLLEEHSRCVFDFGAGAGATESQADLARIEGALAPFPRVFLILPSPDHEETLAILKARDPHPPADLKIDINHLLLEHGGYQRLAKHILYTQGKTPEQSRDEILILSRLAAA